MAEVNAEAQSVEDRAKAQGWRPPENYDGDPKNFVTAEEYLQRGDNIAKAKSREVIELKDELKSMKAELAEMRQGNTEFKELHDRIMTQEKAQREQLIQQLEQAQAKAIDEGKGGEAVNYQNQANALRQQQLQAESQQQNNAQANQQLLMQQFVAENEWYRDDPKLQAMANGISDQVGNELRAKHSAAGTRPSPQEFFQELKRKMVEMNPDHPAFSNVRRKEQASVSNDPASQGSGSRGSRTWDDLPDDAKQASLRMEKTMGLSKDDYLAHFEWDE